MPAQTSVMQHPIAIVGVSALFPGSTDATGFWSDILQGKDLLTDVPPSHWRIEDYYDANPAAPDKTYAKRGGFLKPIDFDALGWGIPPQTLPATDTAQLLALVLAQSVLQDAARENFATMDRSRISVILGVTSAQELLFSMVSRLQRPVWVKALRESGIAEADVQAACDRIAAQYVPWQEASFPGLLGNVVAGRIANRLNLGGTNCVTDAACASTFSALSMAVNELQLGLSDLVIAGGVDTLNDIFMYMCFSKTPALSPSGDCRPFSDQADGTMLGEGLGMFALKRLADAERDGDRIYALLRGIGTASDGRSKSVYAPVAAGQAQALRRAYASAGYSARSVELMEAHGTGTKAGDAAEFEGLRMVFGEAVPGEAGADSTQWCALGSVKSQIGHTKAAAGAAGLFKAVMALHHKILPPSIKIAAPNPSLAIEKSPFYLNTECRPWIRASDHPRRASVSAFGFGGSNFHVTLEEYVPAQGGSGLCAERLATQSADLLLLAAASANELSLRLRELANKTAPLAKIASDSRIAWDALTNKSYRLAIVASSTQELTQRLAVARARIDAAPEQTFELPDGSCYGIGTSEGKVSPEGDTEAKVAMLFPGQGSQYLAMGDALAMQFESARQVWDQAANLNMDGETPLHQVVFPRPVFSTPDLAEQQAELTATEWAQPAIGAHSAALLAQLRALGVNADAYAGHSFGELMALHAAGVFSAKSTIALARRRGELMRDASAHAKGAMTALSLTHTEVEALIGQHQSDVVIANHNAPKQVVISGTTEAIANFEAKLRLADIEFRRLPVAAAFHSKLVASCCDDFTQSLTEVEISQPTAPVFGNQTGAPFANDAEAIRKQLAAQIANPVRFVEMIHAMHESGVRTFIEVGPGAVLTGLVSAILGARPHRAIALDRKGRDGVHTLLSGLARLAAAGIAFQARNLFADTRTPPDVVSTGKLMVPINGSNLGKPYPPKDGDYPAPNLAPNPLRLIANPTTNPVPAAMPVQPSTTTIPRASRAQTLGTSAMTSTPVCAAPNLHTSTVSDAWLSAFQASQAQTAAAQMSFQRTLAESHAAYLRLAESALLGLGGLRPQAVAEAVTTSTPVIPAQIANAPSTSVIPANAGIQANAGVAAIPLDPRLREDDDSGLASRNVPTRLETTFDLPALLLSVVAEKTGYPVEMLALDMDLEGDLGIDSIKRVEILSSVDERAPHLPKVDRARLSALHTLAEIIAYLGGGTSSATPVTPAMTANAQPVIPANAGIQANAGVAAIPLDPRRRGDDSAFDLPALLLSVVAEKTGYPVEMLALDMDLEGDLGIDSIKRVEILSSVDERAPHLPKVDRARLSALHTLAEIIAYLGGGTTANALPVIPAQAGIQPNAEVAAITLDPRLRGNDSAFDLPALLLSIVAEKTGYPVEMLALDMDLEGDLGIDSIKRVEILSSVDERAPHLPKVDRARLSALHTLAEIIAYLGGGIEAAKVVRTQAGIQANTEVAAITLDPRLRGDDGLKYGDDGLTSGDDELANGDDDLLGRYTLELITAPETGFAMPFLLDATPVYLIGHDALAAALALTLRARGVNAHAVTELPDTAIACVYLGGMRSSTDIDAAIAINFEAFQIARTLAAKLGDKGGLFVTVQNTGGDFGLGDAADLSNPAWSNSAWLAGLPALIKTCALEWPRASVKAIDLAAAKYTSTELAETLADELLQGGGELEIALKAGTRSTLVSVARAVQTGASVLAANDVVLVSGGARGVTSACLAEWAKREAEAGRPLRFVLLGRTVLQGEPAACAGIDDSAQLKQIFLAAAKAAGESLTPSALSQRVHAVLAGREIQQSIVTIRAHGAQARYCAVDVQNSAELKRLLDNVRGSWGPIRGLIHAAGVLSDKRIVDKTDAQFAHVFDTKVRGLQALLAATQNDPLRLLCVFSSVSARCGNTGQSDYAMANEVLAKVALHTARTRPELRVKSLGWGPWEAGMVTPQLKARFASLGVPMIPLLRGAQMFADAMNDVSPHAVELVLGGEPRAEALLFDGAESRIEALEVQVQRAGHAYLAGHAVNGEPVVPVVLVAEWLARAARSFRPGLTLIALHDLAVLKGIRLGGFEHGGDRFRIEARPAPAETLLSKGTSELQLMLLDFNGRPRYSARAELHVQAALPGTSAPKLTLDECSGSPYPDQLFHRDQFELIEQMHGISDAGIAAQVRGIQDANWPEQSWHFDVAALDGGMQLAVLYAQRMLGANNLPTAIASVRHYPAPPCAGPIVATAYPRSLSKAASTTDIYFVDGNGQRIAELLGVQNHALVA